MNTKPLLMLFSVLLTSCSGNSVKTIQIEVIDKSILDCAKPYKVLSNDNIARLAQVCDTSIDKLVLLNKLNKPSIQRGQTIYLSNNAIKNKDIANIDKKIVNTKQKITTKPQQTLQKTLQKTYQAKKVAKNQQWTTPVAAKVSKKFSPKNSRLGVEFATKAGQIVYAINDGSIVYSGNRMINHGKMIIIKHPLDFYSSYTQNAILLIKDGDIVKKGDAIAITSDKHFYIEMRKQSKPIDPLKYLPIQ